MPAGSHSPHGAGWDAGPLETARAVRSSGRDVLLLHPAPPAVGGWGGGPLLAVESRVLASWRRSRGTPDPLNDLTERIRRRRLTNNSADTGVLLLLGYEYRELRSSSSRDDDGLPELVAWEVNGALRWSAGCGATATGVPPQALDSLADTLRVEVDHGVPPAARTAGAVRTSLPGDDYRRAVSSVLQRIGRGDIYQANLCQRFHASYSGDPLGLFESMAPRSEAPRCAYLESAGIRLASYSPETFVTVRDGVIETWPIKGTRRRHDDEAADMQAARELLASAKDRAELLMIVDLERNDLGRVCRTGSVEVPVLAQLDSYSTVHHLMARVRGALVDPDDPRAWVEAVFPGGSITGAPKRRAMEILATLEPVRRNFFTGSLLWFADDGTVESSILIRTAVFDDRRVYIGAGGGVVADSSPEAEWREANDKIRAIAQGLGFEPEEAC